MDKQQRLEKIVSGCQDGSEQAFADLVDMYASRCYGYFYRLCGNSAVSNDLLSELFTKLYEKFNTFKGGSFEKWLFTIASNIFHDYLRHRYRQKKLLDAKVSQIEEVKPQSRAEQRMIEKMQIQMQKLDDDTAELLNLRFYGQLSFKELAEIRGEPIGTTLSKVHRGLKKLRDLMGDSSD